MNYNVGDKVRFVGEHKYNYNRSTHLSPLDHGEIGEVEDVEPKSIRVNKCWYNLNELELVEQNNMSNSFQPFYIEVDGPQHSHMLQEIALEEGYEWKGSAGKNITFTDSAVLVFGEFESKISRTSKPEYAEDISSRLEDYTLDEFRQALNGNYDFEETIEVFGYQVDFNDKQKVMVVGCQTYTYGEIKIVYSALSNISAMNLSNIHVEIYEEEEGEIPFNKLEAIYNQITN